MLSYKFILNQYAPTTSLIIKRFKNKCGKVFTGNSAKYKLKKHYKVKHGLNFACSHEHCSKIYKYKWNLNRHMNDHDESVE